MPVESVGREFAADPVCPGCLPAGRLILDIGDAVPLGLESWGTVTTSVGSFEAAGTMDSGLCIDDTSRERLVAMMAGLELVDVGIVGGTDVGTAACNDSGDEPVGSEACVGAEVAVSNDDGASATITLDGTASSPVGLDDTAAATA